MSEKLLKYMDEIVFDDGQNMIDYVLVYTRKNLSNTEHADFFSRLRSNFINYLKEKHKIQIKEQIIKTEKMEIGFYLLHLTWAALIEEAERLKLKVPLKKLKSELKDGYKIRENFSFLKHFHHKIPQAIENDKRAIFLKDNIHKYHITKSKNIHFRTCQRQYVMKEILESIVYKESSFISSKLRKFLSWFNSYNRNENIRLKRLLKDGVLTSSFPLHDGNIDYNKFNFPSQNKEINIDRQLLYDHWASWYCILKFQPLDEIENYFGPKVAFYFAWLGFYTSWLFPMAILGVFFFFFGNYDPSYEDTSNFVCGENSDEIIMCPLCNECTPWHLNDICLVTQINRLFDNIFSVIFALIMNIWVKSAVFFLEFWKRHSKKLSHHWGVLDYERDEEKPSPDYCFYATKEIQNPITQELEAYFPRYLSFLRRLAGTIILSFFVLVAIFFHFIIIFFRLTIHHLLFLTEGLRPFATLFSNISCGIINLGLIILFDKIYEKCAQKITRWEMFRTESEYEESLIVKLFIILAFNYYSHAFYIAFLKGRIKLHFIDETYMETCSHTGCHIEVAFYLFITFVAKQMLKSAYDIAYPRFKRFSNIIRSGLPNAINQWESDYQLHQIDNLIDNYLYLVLQFGFVNLFVAIFPLGPIFAFVFNILAIRINARKLLCESRRMVMVRVNGIGIWFKILENVSYFSVLTNALIIAFSSDVIDKFIYFVENGTIDGFTENNLLYSKISANNLTCGYFESKYHGELTQETLHLYKLFCYKLVFVILYQNVVQWIQKYIEQSVTDTPRHLDIKLKKERFLIKKNLKLNNSNSKSEIIVDMIQNSK